MKTQALRTVLIHCTLVLTIVLVHAKAAEAAAPMITYNRIIVELADQDPTPLIRIYPSGLAVVHIPSYMKRAGTYEAQLSQEELHELIKTMRLAGLPSFDTASSKATRDQLQAENARSGFLSAVSDDEITVIELALPSNQLDKVPDAGSALITRSKFRWKNLQFDAKQFDIPALRAAADAETRLLGLVNEIAPGR
jgi:hypothetical protein